MHRSLLHRSDIVNLHTQANRNFVIGLGVRIREWSVRLLGGTSLPSVILALLTLLLKLPVDTKTVILCS